MAARDQGYIEPISVFPLLTTITMIVMALFGGKGTVWGPVLGAVVLFVFQEVVGRASSTCTSFGAIIVAVVLMMPRGVLGLLQMQVPAAEDHLMCAVLRVEGLRKSGGVAAVNGVSLALERGASTASSDPTGPARPRSSTASPV